MALLLHLRFIRFSQHRNTPSAAEPPVRKDLTTGGDVVRSSEIRVTSGQFRGRRLQAGVSGTHPMGAREKLALFNMVKVESIKVLDLYAGSGALGIEALSRGATEAVFVESAKPAVSVIESNLQQLGIHVIEMRSGHSSVAGEGSYLEADYPCAKVYHETVQKFISRSEYFKYFQVIFADPPYDDFRPNQFQTVAQLLSKEGILALSSPAAQPALPLDNLTLISSRSYANARITLYRKA